MALGDCSKVVDNAPQNDRDLHLGDSDQARDLALGKVMLEPEREYLAITIGQLANGWPDRDARLNPLKALVALAQQVGKRHRIAVPVGSSACSDVEW